MAKFRRAHQKRSGQLFPSSVKILFILGIILLLFLVAKPAVYKWTSQILTTPKSVSEVFYLPVGSDDPIYQYRGFWLAYDERTEQPSWVAYELTIAQLNAPKVSRTDYFKEDHKITSGSATFSDYKNSGYTKGHLVPAADRAYSLETMEETFLMSNISPQIYECNGGIWRELEEQTRDWARKNKALYIVSGPIFPRFGQRYIGKNKVAVPDAFFKVILDATEPEMMGIAFLIPNALSNKPLQDYAMTIDQVEEKTGLDFFAELLSDNLEDSLENKLELNQWNFSEQRFKKRVADWNNR